MNTEDRPSPQCPRCGSPVPADAPHGLCPKCVLGAVADPAAPESAGRGRRPEPPSMESVRAVFPQLVIEECIGQGGMGCVYRARQPSLDRPVALKLLWPGLAADPTFAERFQREGRVLARLSHTNIVAVYDFGRAGDYYYLLMELVDGVNLRQAMQAGRFSASEALALVPHVCAALQYAHEEGILHRDIKPENILLDVKGRVKIVDFGIAKLLGRGDGNEDVTLTRTGAAVGTPHYMAPEQIERPEDVDPRADVFSVGVVCYELLTGELPLGRFALPSERAAVDGRVDEVVLRSLERHREKRFSTAGEVGTRVEDIRNSPLPGVAAGAPPPPPIPRTPAAVAGRAGGSGAPPPSSGPAANIDPARRATLWSWLAWIGAGFVLLSLMLALPLALLAGVGPALQPPQVEPGMGARSIPSTGSWLAVGALLIVVLAGGLGTVLGAISLLKFRGGAAGWRGARAAVFASLALPLLVFDVLLGRLLGVSLYLVLAPFVTKFGVTPAAWTSVVALVTLAACVFVDVLAVGWVWRWTRGWSVASRRARWMGAGLAAATLALVILARFAPAVPVVTVGLVPVAPIQLIENGAASQYPWEVVVGPRLTADLCVVVRSNATVISRHVLPTVTTAPGEQITGKCLVDVFQPVPELLERPNWRWYIDFGRFGGGRDRFIGSQGRHIAWSVLRRERSEELVRPGIFEWILLSGDQVSIPPEFARASWTLSLEVNWHPNP